MRKYRKTKAGLAICPYFGWASEDIEGLGQQENDVNLSFCSHPDNKEPYEGNCQERNCPLISSSYEEKLRKHIKLCKRNLKNKRIKCCASCPFEEMIIKEYPEMEEMFEEKRNEK